MHETNNKQSTFKTVMSVMAILLALIMVAGVFFVLFRKDDSGMPGLDNQLQASDGMIMSGEVDGNGIALMSAVIPVEQYAKYGVSPNAESTYQVTATVKDLSGATPSEIQAVDWSMSWATPNSADITNYVTMKTSGMQAIFSCFQGFSTQIIVKVMSTIDKTKSVTFPIDYAKRLSGATVKFLNGSSTTVTSAGKTINATFPAEYRVDEGLIDYATGDWVADLLWFEKATFSAAGTVDNNATCAITITPSAAFRTAYKNNLPNDIYSHSDMATSLSGNTSTSSTLNAFKNINSLYCSLSQDATYDADELSFMGIYRAMSLALGETTNQFEVTLTLTPTYGEAMTYKYILNVSVNPPAIGSVETDRPSGWIF